MKYNETPYNPYIFVTSTSLDTNVQKTTEESKDSIWQLVIKDMYAREEMGIKKYGKPVLLKDERCSLQDLYEELLDAAVYCKKELEIKQSITEIKKQVIKDLEEIKPITGFFLASDINTLINKYKEDLKNG